MTRGPLSETVDDKATTLIIRPVVHALTLALTCQTVNINSRLGARHVAVRTYSTAVGTRDLWPWHVVDVASGVSQSVHAGPAATSDRRRIKLFIVCTYTSLMRRRYEARLAV